MFQSISDIDTHPCRLRELQSKLRSNRQYTLELASTDGTLFFRVSIPIFSVRDCPLNPKPCNPASSFSSQRRGNEMPPSKIVRQPL